MMARRGWFGRSGRAVWWWSVRWLILAVVPASAAGCGFSGPPSCADRDAAGDCDPTIDDPGGAVDLPEGTLECDLYPVEGSATGQCVPYVDAGWHTMLARMAYLPKSQLRCPESAPNAGLYGVEIPDGPEEPRRVIGCSVNPLSTCPTPATACVPFEPDYQACLVQSGVHTCQEDYYPQRTSVEEDGLGAEVTVCCRSSDGPH